MTSIGQYRILEVLGRGGMGVVYRALDTQSGRAVALKTVSKPTAQWLDSIRNEVRALSRVRHPGIVRILAHGEHQGRPWYAMELVEGETLSDYCRRIWSGVRAAPVELLSTLPRSSHVADVRPTLPTLDDVSLARTSAPRTAQARPAAAGDLHAVLQLMRRVCAAVAYLHGEGFVSCDLKPDNIIVAKGWPVLIDFGLSAFHPGRSGRETPLALRRGGTVLYMSPEQVRGEFVDARSDLYALGCILYELVTEAPPFLGNAVQILQRHLELRPVEPAALVEGLDPRLNQLIMRLLEKRPANRYGYADEVAENIAQIDGDASPLDIYPAPSPYLYRPHFVGREPMLAELTKIRDRIERNSGAFVLVGGESGVGKTRLAMELTRGLSLQNIRTVVSEVQPPVRDSRAAVIGTSPLAMVRPLLRAVADRCQEAGAAASDFLLGEHGALLARYEPLLEDVPGFDRIAAVPLIELPPEAAARRLFQALQTTLQRFAQDRALFWIIDDLGWADELSLSFLAQLSSDFFEAHGIFVLGTFRSEEPSPALEQLIAEAHVQVIELGPLPNEAVASMAADMLAGQSARALAAELARVTDGNPFFVAEYLRTAISEARLSRTHGGDWKLVDEPLAAGSSPVLLQLPTSLRALMARRIQRLSGQCQAIVRAAAVLGRESSPAVLQEVADVTSDALESALDELQRRQVIERTPHDQLRFIHDQLREAAMMREQSAPLHLRAARALERRLSEANDANRELVAIGHHFAAAQHHASAAQYLERAAQRARGASAQADALRLYSEALKQVELEIAAHPANTQEWTPRKADMNEALGDLASLAAQRAVAREAFALSLELHPPEPRATRARILRKVGRTWEAEHQHNHALNAYSKALDVLVGHRESAEARDEWIQSQIEIISVHYWRANLDGMARALAALKDAVVDHGSAVQRGRYHHAALWLALRSQRYAVGATALGHARAAVEVISTRHALAEYPMAQFMLGFTLLLTPALSEAHQTLQEALRCARQMGDAAQESRCLIYLAIAARKLGDHEQTAYYTDEAERVGAASGQLEYRGAATSNRAWIALHAGQHEHARREAESALERWRALPVVYPFQWLAAIPLLQLHAADGALTAAVTLAEMLLAASQQVLPERGSGLLAALLEHATNEREAEALEVLRAALHALRSKGYT